MASRPPPPQSHPLRILGRLENPAGVHLPPPACPFSRRHKTTSVPKNADVRCIDDVATFLRPKIVLQVYGVDMLGRDVVRGYGARHLPISPGIHEQDVAMFVPVTSNFIQQALGWIVGKQPEFIDPKFVAQGNGREVTRVQSQGNVTLQLTTVMKDFTRFGFRVGQHGGSGDGD